jgi:AraC-like DNA-binding protein
MTGLVSPTPPLRFSTRAVPGANRSRALHELSEQGLLPVLPLPGRDPHADLVKWRLPGASVLSGSFAGVRQHGGPAAAGRDELFFGINRSGRSLARQQGRELTVGAGDAVFIDPGGGAFDVVRPEACQLIGIRLPRHAVPPGAAGRAGPPLRLVPAGAPALDLLTRYLGSVLGGPEPASVRLADAIAGHLAELIELSLAGLPGEAGAGAALRPAREPGVRAARLAALRADVGRHLTDHGLTVAAVAARHGITPRYLHMLFEDEGVTFAQFVLQERLALAYRRLRDPRYAGRTVSAIAYGTGFGDLSWFNRAFRRRYSVTPTEARRPGPRPG